MGKNQHSKDRLFVTATEWKRDYGGKKDETRTAYRKLPFDCCGISFRPFEKPVCTQDGIVFDILNIVPYIKEHKMNPITGAPLSTKELIRLNFYKNAEDKYHCPVTFKIFNDSTTIAAIKPSGNVYNYEAIQELNIKGKNWTDLLSGEPFTKADIIILQDPKDSTSREMDKFFHVAQKAGGNSELALATNMSIRANSATQRILDKVKENEKKRTSAEISPALQTITAPSKKMRAEVEGLMMKSRFTSGSAGMSLTSSSVEISTMSEYVDASAAEINEMRWKRMRGLKKKGYARITTNLGDLNVELHCDMAPMTTENFIGLSNKEYYNGLKFHRSIKNFMIQGGDPTGKGTGGESFWGGSFKDEFDSRLLHDSRGVLAMANSGPATNKSQFYITFKQCNHLNNKHSVFGKVVGGLETLRAMEQVETGEKDRPKEDIIIQRIIVFVNPFEELREILLQEQEAAKMPAPTTIIKVQPKATTTTTTTPSTITAAPVIGRYLASSTSSTAPSSTTIPTTSSTIDDNSNDNSTKNNEVESKVPKKTSYGNFSGW